MPITPENYEVIKECWARGCGCEQAANPKMKAALCCGQLSRHNAKQLHRQCCGHIMHPYFAFILCIIMQSMHSDSVQAILISLLAICVFGIGSDGVKLVWEKFFGTKKDKEKKEKKEKKADIFCCMFFPVQRIAGLLPQIPIQESVVCSRLVGFGVQQCRVSF